MSAHDHLPMLGALELGGTKTVAAVGRSPLDPVAQVRIDTRDPDETLAAVENFLLAAARDHGPLRAVGVASFGPLDFEAGGLGPTPKPGWSGVGIRERLRHALGCAVALETDVSAAAVAEAALGAGQGLFSLAYVTVGTGIGGGLVLNGHPVRGLLHPEMGHLRLRRDPNDAFPGRCPYHGDCVEGLASGPAIADRFGMSLAELAPDHPFRAILAGYLGRLLASIVLVASPERVVLGGGVMTGGGHAAVAAAMRAELAGYVVAPALERPDYVVPPAFADSGLVGAFLLGQALAAA